MFRGTLLFIALTLSLASCSPTGPFAANDPVQIYTATHHPQLIADIEAGGGPDLNEAIRLAGVNDATREILILRLQSELPLYRRSPRALAIAINSHGA